MMLIRRLLLFGAAAVALLLPIVTAVPADTRPAATAVPPAPAGYEAGLWRRAVTLTHRALVIDTHCDATGRMQKAEYNFAADTPEVHVDIPKMRRGGLDAEFMAAFTSPRHEGADAVTEALGQLEALRDTVDRHPGALVFARTAGEVEAAPRAGRLALLASLENGTPILENRLDLLRLYHRLGVRYIGLCHNTSNFLCDSSTDTPTSGGLSTWGRTVVREMNRLGIMVDVSHLADATVRDLFETSQAPVFASHSACRALCNAPRNLPDELIRAIGRRGGVVQVNFYASFLSDEYGRREEERRERLRPEIDRVRALFTTDMDAYFREITRIFKNHPIPPPPVSALVDHIDHVVRLAGIDHVGIGSDFDGISAMPEGMNGCQDLPMVTYHLLQRGYSEPDIEKILGRNFLRYFREVERTAARLQRPEPAAVEAGQ
ncbi:MAG: membrane dipeptidase [Acidobacteria bacterium]|nr:membrane dipeptidase [Acidobacteriota bacterium]